MTGRTLQFKSLVIAGCALFFAPFIVYAFSRLMGQLPSENAWRDLGMNHGPWRWKWQGFILYLPFLAPLVTMTVGIFSNRKEAKDFLKKALLLSSCQLAIAVIPLLTLFWTVD